MIELLSKPVDEIGTADILALINLEVPEGEQVEFKKEPPGENGKPDPWMNGHKMVNYAKDRILKEVLAFANAYGGMLVIGIDESVTKPAVATRITAVPRCVELAESLKLVFRDRVEPQLARIDIAGIPTENDGSGVVIIRVGKSRLAPHRVTRTLICPIRRADRSEEMTMREIQDMTLNVSRGLEGLEKRLAQRCKNFSREFTRPTFERKLGFRVTGVPVVDEIRFDRVFRRGGLVEGFDVQKKTIFRVTNGRDPFHAPVAGTGIDRWRPLLRGARAEQEFKGSPGHFYFCYSELHCDGLVESGWIQECEEGIWSERLTAMFANLAHWADRIRQNADAVTLEYALSAELRTTGNVIIDGPVQKVANLREPFETRFPQYALNEPDQIGRLLTQFNRDLWHSMREDVEDLLYETG